MLWYGRMNSFAVCLNIIFHFNIFYFCDILVLGTTAGFYFKHKEIVHSFALSSNLVMFVSLIIISQLCFVMSGGI